MRQMGVWVLGFGLLLAPAALAADPSVATYGGRGGEVSKSLEQGAEAKVGVTQTLPFTGLDITLLVGAGLLFLALGIVLRKTARKRG